MRPEGVSQRKKGNDPNVNGACDLQACSAVSLEGENWTFTHNCIIYLFLLYIYIYIYIGKLLGLFMGNGVLFQELHV